ncbi:MAG: acyl-ACP--UDP-N-acetylglucosamine O-acyltransferase [Steroidobacteraceae bacterium]
MIDAHAVVSPQAELAGDVEVGPFAVIGPGVRIGARTVIGAHAVITGDTTVGADNKVFQFASLGDAPQDLKYQDEPTRLEIGDRNVFREYCTVNRGTAQGGGVTRLGDDNLLMACSHVAHDCHVGSKIVMANYVALGGHVQLGDWVIMAGYSGVHQFCKIGAHAFIANNAAVTRDVPPFIMVVGQPARPHSINSEGLKRRGFSEEQIRALRDAYRTLYRRELPLAEALEELKAVAQQHSVVQSLVDFIGAATRSLIR